MNDKITRSNSY